MTDQPTKWYQLVGAYEIQLSTNNASVIFTGPDREANARRFILMDELMEAAQPFAELATDIEEAANLYEGPESDPNNWAKSCDWADLARIRDTLAKIKGDK